MKRCPECRRDYYDDTLLYCLDDGNALLEGPAAATSEPPASVGGQFDSEPHTAILHSTAAPGEAPTRAQILNAGATAILPNANDKSPARTASRGNSLIAGILGIILVTALGVGSYLYYGRGSAKQINSIAVMPFENRNSDADTDYLSDGLAESVIFRLTQIPDLRVSPTSSVMRYKGASTDVAKIAAELGVDAVMTGRLTKRGDNLNITVELVDARTNNSLWGEQYERKLSELLTTQREIVAEIVGKLQLKLSGESEQKLAKKYTDNNEAYQLYLQGRFHWNKRTTEDFQKAREYFQQAVANDPNYALAHTGLADTLAQMPYYGNFKPTEYMPLAKQSAQKALEIDPHLAEAHASLGQILIYDYDLKGAESELRRAIELNPKYPSAYLWLSEVYYYQGKGDQALAEINKALELDPLSMIINNVKGRVLDFGGKRDEAIAQFKKTIELFPDALSLRNNLADLYEAKGMHPEATEQRLIHIKLFFGVSPENIKDLQLAYEKGGYKGFVQKQIDIQLDSQRSSLEKDKNAYLPAFRIAVDYARLQDKDKAFEYLNKAYDQREPQIAELKIRLPLSFLRDDPRFKELIRRVGIPE